jgi:hypothetical protein
MSEKELAIRVIEHLPDSCSIPQILVSIRAAWQAQSPDSADGDKWSAEELSEDEWAALIGHTLQTELNDPREDIYTLMDGVPVDGPR